MTWIRELEDAEHRKRRVNMVLNEDLNHAEIDSLFEEEKKHEFEDLEKQIKEIEQSLSQSIEESERLFERSERGLIKKWSKKREKNGEQSQFEELFENFKKHAEELKMIRKYGQYLLRDVVESDIVLRLHQHLNHVFSHPETKSAIFILYRGEDENSLEGYEVYYPYNLQGKKIEIKVPE